MLWYKQLGYARPSDYFTDPVRFPDARVLKLPGIVRMAIDTMCDEEGIPRSGKLRCCRSCGKMTESNDTCDQCGSPV